MRLFQDGLYYNYNNLTLSAGNNYSGTFSVYANNSAAAHTYTAVVTASDAAHSNTVAAAGAAVQQYDNQPPTISSTAISCPGITAMGNVLLITATVVDSGTNASGVRSVSANIYANGACYSSQSYIYLTNNGSGSSYSGTCTIPVNNGGAPIVWTAAISAQDNANNTASAPVAGSVTQPNDNTPPTITNATLLPASRPAGGGTLLLSATVSDAGSGVNNVTAYICVNGIWPDWWLYRILSQSLYYPYNYAVTLSNGGNGNVYSGTLNIGANNTGLTNYYTAGIHATDGAGNYANVMASGSCVQPSQAAAVTPPVISADEILPASLPATGGTLTINASVTDANGPGLKYVNAELFRDNAYYDNVLLVIPAPGRYTRPPII